MSIFDENREALDAYVENPRDPERQRHVKDTMRLVVEALKLVAGTEVATRVAAGFAVFIAEIDHLQSSEEPLVSGIGLGDGDPALVVDRKDKLVEASERLQAVLVDVIAELQATQRS